MAALLFLFALLAPLGEEHFFRVHRRLPLFEELGRIQEKAPPSDGILKVLDLLVLDI